MDQTIDLDTPAEKIYKDGAIWAGVFLGGPLVAGYLIAENFKVFNDLDKARKTWIYTVLATVAILVGAVFIPFPDTFPSQLIPIIYTGITYSLVQHFQGEKIKSHISAGGQIYKWWRAVFIGLIGAIITVLPILAYVYLTDPAFTATTKTYGTLKHEIMFNEDNISEAEVDQIADGLTLTNFFDPFQQKFIFAKKEENLYVIIIPVIDNSWNRPEVVEEFEQLRKSLQAIMPNKRFAIDLCTDLDNIKKRIE